MNRDAMTHAICPGCELRFAEAAAASLLTCPFCGGALVRAEARHLVGFQLVERVSVSLPPAPGSRNNNNG